MKHKKLTMIVALVLVVALAAGLGIWADRKSTRLNSSH